MEFENLIKEDWNSKMIRICYFLFVKITESILFNLLLFSFL
jgi:hypothetical protein